MSPVTALLRNRPLLVEIFVIFNLAFLALDVFLAHAINDFAFSLQWLPVVFSVLSPLVLVYGLARARGDFLAPVVRTVGMVVGLASIGVGIGGMVLHLESRFFIEQSIQSLVYTAPFVAPLAYAGLGFLLLLNRMVANASVEWGQWVVFLALGGFAGNFALSLADHAQNGFFDGREWIPVVASAFAISFLVVGLLNPRNRGFLRLCIPLLIVQALVGALGFVLHLMANIAGPARELQQDFLFGAPVFAPMLFVDLALLAMLGMLDLITKAEEGREA